MGLHAKQFYETTLMQVAARTHPNIPWSDTAKLLVLETIWHESGGLRYTAQMPGFGPAHGLCQMERPTFDWLVKDWLHRYESARAFIVGYPRPDFRQLDWNNAMAVIMCRLRYLVIAEALPAMVGGVQARAAYWGRYYQTTNDPDKIAKYIADAADLGRLL